VNFWQVLTHFLYHNFVHYEFVLLFVLPLIESAGIPLPVPSDTFILLAGARHAPAPGYTLAVLATAWVGALSGASLLFFIMRTGGRPFLDRYGKYIFLEKKRLDRIEGWFRQRGRWIVIVGWLLPGLRIPTIIMAGLSGMTYLTFLPLAMVAVFIVVAFYYGVGVAISAQGRHVVHFVTALGEHYAAVLIISTIILALVLTVVVLWRKGLLARTQGG
jgi:membrane protein DedA with SNARE-associated domain